MKPFYKISVYLLTDHLGDWYEDCNTEGTTARWLSGKAEFHKTKEFKTAEAAQKYAEKRFKSFRIIYMTPPVAPSITWGQETVYDNGNIILHPVES